MKVLTERAALLLGLAEALNKWRSGDSTSASYYVMQSNRKALGLQPSGLMPYAEEITCRNGAVVVSVESCTCGMGEGLGQLYGHEPYCGLEFVCFPDDVAWCIVRNDYEKEWV